MHHPRFCYQPDPRRAAQGLIIPAARTWLPQIDTICKAQGLYPHAVLSGHAHNYQRFTRTIRFGGGDIEVPFIICGDGGHDVLKVVQGKSGQAPQEPQYGVQVDYLEPAQPAVQAKSLVLEHYDDTNLGYLRITVDKSNLQLDFHQVGTGSIAQSCADTVTVESATRTVVG